MLQRSALVLYFLSFVLMSASLASAMSYSITDLGCLGTGTQSYAFAVNNSGQVAGYSYLAPATGTNDLYHAFYYDGTLHDLGTFGGGRSYAYAINNSGQVAGGAQNKVEGSPLGISHAFVYSGGTMIDLTAKPGGLSDTTSSRAYGINSTGQAAVSGYFSTRGRGAFYDGTTVNELGTLAGGSGGTNNAYGLNDSGQLVGVSASTAGNRPVLYSGGTVYNLGTLGGGGDGSAQAINAGGRIAGFAPVATTNNLHAFRWDPNTLNGTAGTMSDLGTLGGTTSKAYGINFGGQVVGYALTADGAQHAFFYDNAMHDLSSTAMVPNLGGWTLTYAGGISDSGYICGYGTNPAGETHAFLLKPSLLPGDANGDGVVNILDLNKVLTNYDRSGLTWSDGDFNSDGKVDVTDLNKVLTNYDKSATGSSRDFAAVPEPSALVLLAVAAAGLLVGTRCRAQRVSSRGA